MPSPTSCPSCTASLQIPGSARGRKMSCPHCGQALVITSGGIAKRDEGHGATPATRGFPWLLSALALLLTISAIIVGCIALRRHDSPHELIVAKKDDEPKRSSDQGREHVPVKPGPTPKPKDSPKEKDPPKEEGPPKKELKPNLEVVPPVEVKPEKPSPVSVKLTRTYGPLAADYYVPVLGLAFSPDDKSLAACGGDFVSGSGTKGQMMVWDLASGKASFNQKVQGVRAWSLAFGPGGKTLVVMNDWDTRPLPRSEESKRSGGYMSKARIWDLASGKMLKEIEDIWGNVPALSSDGKLVAAGFAPADATPVNGAIKLWDIDTGKSVATLEGHSDLMGGLVFSSDGRMLASASLDKTVKLWDLSTGKCTLTLPAPERALQTYGLAFSRDGKTLAVGPVGKGAVVKLFDVSSGTLTASLAVFGNNPKEMLFCCPAFSPNGRLLYVATNQGAKLWDVASLRPVAALDTKTSFAAFSHNGKLLAVVNNDGTWKPGQPHPAVTVWEIEDKTEFAKDDPKVIPPIPLDPNPKSSPKDSGSGMAVAFSKDGKTLASGHSLWEAATGKDAAKERGEVRLWDVATGKKTKTLEGHAKGVRSVAFSPDGQTLLSGSQDNTVKLWDLAGGKVIKTLAGHGTMVTSVAFSPDGETFATAGDGEQTIKLWDAAVAKMPKVLKGSAATEFTSVAFSPDGKTLASARVISGPSGAMGDLLRLWDVASGNNTKALTPPKVGTLPGPAAGVWTVAFSRDGKTLASQNTNGMQVWDIAKGTTTATLPCPNSGVWTVAISPDGNFVATETVQQQVLLWHVATGKTVNLKGHTQRISSLAFSPDSKTLASTGDETIKLWDVASGTCTATLGK